MGAMRGEHARSKLNFGMSLLMEQMNGKRCQDVCSGIRKKNVENMRKSNTGENFKEWTTGLKTAGKMLN